MDYAIRIIKAVSPAIIIVAVAAFVLGIVYESLAYNENIDVNQDESTNYAPGTSLDAMDGKYVRWIQTFDTGATTTNLSNLRLYGKDYPARCGLGGGDDFAYMAVCAGEPTAYDMETTEATGWPCEGGTLVYDQMVNIPVLASSTTGWFYVDWLDSLGAPLDLLPATDYFFDIKLFNLDYDQPCWVLYYDSSDHYADGGMWGDSSITDWRFQTYTYSDYAYGTSTTPDYTNILATSAPMIVVPSAWSCCYDTATDDCKIPVYFNEAALDRDTNVLLDEYNYSTYGPVLDTVMFTYAMNYSTELSYYPKENTGVANQARIVEAWYSDGITGSVDHIVNMTWENCGGWESGLVLTNVMSDPGCVCSETENLIECGLTRAACWAFKSSTSTMAKFEKARNRLLSGFPFNIFYQADKQMKIINATNWSAGEIDFYYIGYPTTSSSTLIGSINGTDMRTNLDNFGWTYIYFIMEKILQLGFIGLILWRLWHIITGEHFESEESHTDNTLVPRNNSKKRYASKEQVPVINLRK